MSVQDKAQAQLSQLDKEVSTLVLERDKSPAIMACIPKPRLLLPLHLQQQACVLTVFCAF